MNAELSLLALFIGLLTFGASGAFGWYTLQQRRHLPETLEDQLRQQVRELNATIKTLQRHLAEDAQRMEQMETRLQSSERHAFEQSMKIRILEAELTHYRAVLPQKVAYKPHKLTADDLKTLRSGLLDTYTTIGQWRSLLGDIDHNLDAISVEDNLEDIVTTVLRTANDEGWILKLMTEAAAGRMHVTALRELVAELTTPTHLKM